MRSDLSFGVRFSESMSTLSSCIAQALFRGLSENLTSRGSFPIPSRLYGAALVTLQGLSRTDFSIISVAEMPGTQLLLG